MPLSSSLQLLVSGAILAFGLLYNKGFASEDTVWVPPGFESLAEPQETLIDVFYGGIYVTSVSAEFTPSTITIRDAEPVAERLNDIIDRAEFVELLEFPLATNSELVCKSKFSVDCGRLETTSVAVIFDRSKLKADLFIAPSLLSVKTIDQLNFLPASDSGFSLVDDFALYASSGSELDTSYNVSNITLFSYAESRLRIDSNYTPEQDFTIDTLALERERNGRDIKLGAFRTNAGNFLFMQNQQFVGGTFESSLVTRTDLEASLGNTLLVFLDSRSLVQLYKDDRLLGSRYYDTGNQELDTSTLPNGSYEVEIRITDSSGRTRTERQFYSKSSKVPPKDQPLYFIQAGRYAQSTQDSILPELLDDDFVRAGYSLRMLDNLAGNVGASWNSESTMLESGIFYQGLNSELSASLAADDDSQLGLDIRYRHRFEDGTVTLYGRHVSDSDRISDEFSQIGQQSSQVNIDATVFTRTGRWNGFVNYTEDDDTKTNESYGIRWSPPSFNWHGNWSGNVELSENRGDALFLVRISYSMRSGSWTNTANAEHRRTKAEGSRSENRFTGGLSTSWQNDRMAANQYRFNLRADHQDTDTIESSLDATSNNGSANITIKHDVDNQSWQYNGAMRTSLAMAPKAVGYGGESRSSAGFLVRIDAHHDNDTQVAVHLNGLRQTSVPANKTTFVGVSPYETYEVELIPEGNTIENISYRTRTYTLYPGNVIPIAAQLQQITVIVGRVILEDGALLENALLSGVEGLAMTDTNGVFQAEIASGTRSIQLKKGGDICDIPLPEWEDDRTVAFLGDLVCRYPQATQ